jgi:acyl carrier protein
LYIGGDGLARGYFNQPELTAESFIPSPFQRGSNSRLYKTGDLARYLPDGNIQFLGRVDHQVKIRGYRVELDEIQLALNQHPQIRENVVVAWESERGQQLAAYFVPASELVPSSEKLRSFLQARLPDYMLPAAFISLEALPVTPNGKVDRRSLPRPDEVGEDEEDTFVAPHTDTEAAIAQIWQELLGVERVGRYEDFFSSGGHSLLVMQLVARLRNIFEVELPVNSVFERPTPAGIAEQIETLLWAKHTNQRPTRVRTGSEREEFEI